MHRGVCRHVHISAPSLFSVHSNRGARAWRHLLRGEVTPAAPRAGSLFDYCFTSTRVCHKYKPLPGDRGNVGYTHQSSLWPCLVCGTRSCTYCVYHTEWRAFYVHFAWSTCIQGDSLLGLYLFEARGAAQVSPIDKGFTPYLQ